MIVGARTIKTGIAVTISMFLCALLDIELAIFAGAATVLNLQPSVGLSLYNAKEQLIIHFTSISIATVLGFMIGSNPLIMGLTSIIIIMVGNKLRWKSGSVGGIMAALFILGSPSSEFLQHAMTRSISITIGVAVALLVNMTIARPNYRKPLLTKLMELNTAIAGYFTEAMQSYLQLNIAAGEGHEKRAKTIEQLFRESQKLYDLYVIDLGPAPDDPGTINKENTEPALLSAYFTYNKGLWQSTRDVLFLAEQRRERRQRSGDMPISPEFQEILALLDSAVQMFVHYNDELTLKLQGKNVEPGTELRIWRKLDEIINGWHDRFPSGSYYLHALVEVSILTDKIRWAAKESSRLLDLHASGS
jgi:hypothetical protein